MIDRHAPSDRSRSISGARGDRGDDRLDVADDPTDGFVGYPELSEMDRVGWCHLASAPDDAAVISALTSLAHRLGHAVDGRNGARIEIIEPTTAERAHPRSLSARHSLDALPLHVELSHRALPCRYLLLGCLGTGTPNVATTLLDRRTLDLSPDDVTLLRSAPLLVRSGRRSFYSTILPVGGGYLRYDRTCMEAVDDRGRAALALMEERLRLRAPERHDWRAGDVLAIDNWRVLHGRASATATAGRRLARMLIDA